MIIWFEMKVNMTALDSLWYIMYHFKVKKDKQIENKLVVEEVVVAVCLLMRNDCLHF